MQGRKRVLKAFNHKEPDRVPIAALGVDSSVASAILGREAWTSGDVDARQYKKKVEMLQKGKLKEYFFQKAKDKIELNRTMGLDLYFGLEILRGETPPEEVGENTWKFTDRETGNWSVRKADLKTGFSGEVDSRIKREGISAFRRTVEQLEDVSYDRSDFSLEIFDYVIEEVGEEMAVVGTADVSIPTGASWFPVFLKATIQEPELVNRYLDAQLERTLICLRGQLESGAPVVWGGVDWADTRDVLLSPDFFNRFVKPRLGEIVDLCHQYGVPYVKHTDGNIRKVLEDLLLEPGVDGFMAIEPNAGMDIFELNEEYGDRLTFLGNVDCSTTLVTGSKEEIRKEVKELIAGVSPGGGHIVMSSNSIHGDIPPQNWIAMIEAAKEFGQYPIKL